MGIPNKQMNRFVTLLKTAEKELNKDVSTNVFLNHEKAKKDKRYSNGEIQRCTITKGVSREDCFSIVEKNEINEYVNMSIAIEYGKEDNFLMFEFDPNRKHVQINKEIILKIMKYQKTIIEKLSAINSNITISVVSNKDVTSIFEPYIKIIAELLSKEIGGNIVYQKNN